MDYNPRWGYLPHFNFFLLIIFYPPFLGQINLNYDCHVGLNFVSFLPILKSRTWNALPSGLQRRHETATCFFVPRQPRRIAVLPCQLPLLSHGDYAVIRIWRNGAALHLTGTYFHLGSPVSSPPVKTPVKEGPLEFHPPLSLRPNLL